MRIETPTLVSVGSGIGRVALSRGLEAARAILETGEFGSLSGAVTNAEMNELLG